MKRFSTFLEVTYCQSVRMLRRMLAMLSSLFRRFFSNIKKAKR